MSNSVAVNQKQEFDLHIAFLTDTHKALLDSTGKVAGFLIVALGWLATSEGARTYLSRSPRVAAAFALAVVAAYSMSAALSWFAHRACATTYRSLLDLDYLPERAFEVRKPSAFVLAVYVVGNGVLAATVAVLALSR